MSTYLDSYIIKATNEINKTESYIDEAVNNEFSAFKEKIIDRWKSGKSVIDGALIGQYFFDSYRNYKISINPRAGGNVDLTLTGALGQGLTVRKKGKKYEIFSTDKKYNKIGQKYGFEEFGLTEEQQNTLFDTIITQVFERQFNNIYKY